MSTDANRQAFEAWYVTNAFDLAASPIGSRDCALQWAAWQAGAASQGDEVRRLRMLSQEWASAALELQTQQALGLIGKFADVVTDRRGRTTYSMDSFGVVGFARAIAGGDK